MRVHWVRSTSIWILHQVYKNNVKKWDFAQQQRKKKKGKTKRNKILVSRISKCHTLFVLTLLFFFFIGLINSVDRSSHRKHTHTHPYRTIVNSKNTVFYSFRASTNTNTHTYILDTQPRDIDFYSFSKHFNG